MTSAAIAELRAATNTIGVLRLAVHVVLLQLDTGCLSSLALLSIDCLFPSPGVLCVVLTCTEEWIRLRGRDGGSDEGRERGGDG